MTLRNLSLLIILNLVLLIGCSNDDDNVQESDTNKLTNTIWFNNSGNCHVYYKFENNNFESLNPCLDNNQFDIVTYEAGSYKIDQNKLILSTSESCNENEINTESSFEFTVTETALTFIENNQKLILQKTNQWPNLPDNIEYGYFDFDNDGFWKVTPDCKP